MVLVVLGWLAAKGVRWALQRWLSRGHTPSFATVMSEIAGWTMMTVAVLAAITSRGPRPPRIEMPAEIIAPQATPSFRAALQGDGDVTPGGSLVAPKTPTACTPTA